MRITVAVLAGLIFAAAAVPANAAAGKVDRAAFDRILQSETQMPGASSISVAVVKDGRLVYSGAAGLADREDSKPATVQTSYNLASVTKSFTAEAVLMLAERGKIRLDDPLSVYRPDLPHAGEVTIRQMLQQTSCLPDVGQTPESIAALNADSTGEKALASAFAAPLWCSPGRRFVYANANFLTLGKVVERVSGMRLDEFFRRNVFQPVGITRFHFGPDAASAKPYILSRRRGMIATNPYPYAAEGGAGALFMTAADVARFDAALIKGRYLAVADQRSAWAPEIFADGSAGRYGMGWFVGDLDTQDSFSRTLGDANVVEHTGSNPGYQTRNAIFPNANVAIVILANSSSYDTYGLFKKIAAIVVPNSTLNASAVPSASERPEDRRMAQDVYAQLVAGTLPRSRLSPRYWAGYTPDFQRSVSEQLKALGPAAALELVRAETNGDERVVDYKIVTAKDPVRLHLGYESDGSISSIDLQ